MKKGIVISMITASILLLQGCDNASSKASENQNTSTKSNAESQNTKEELESLKKENKDLAKKVEDLEAKTDKKQNDTDSKESNKETAQQSSPNTDSKESNKEATQQSSSNTDKEKLKKQLTDGTFIAPKSNAEGRLSIAELEMSLKEYLMPKNANHEEYELEKSESSTPDNKLVYAFKKDNHKGSMVTTGYYVLDGNGYIYKYNFMEEKAEDTPLTNIYIAGVLPNNEDDSTIENEWQTYEEHQKEKEEKIKEDKKNGTYDKNDPLKYQ